MEITFKLERSKYSRKGEGIIYIERKTIKYRLINKEIIKC